MSGGRPGAARWIVAVLAALGTVICLGLLAVVLAPPLLSVTQVEVVEDPQTYRIGSTAEIEIDAGWSAQPVAGEGQLIRSPDRELVVILRAADAEDRLEGRVLAETLSNGAELSHVSAGSETTALLRLPGAGEAILVKATVADGVNPANYRAQLAELLLHVKPVA